MRIAGLLVLALGCDPEPSTLADCPALSDPAAREACTWRFVEPLAQDPTALEQALATIEDPRSRDLVLLRLAIRSPDRAARYCQQVSTDGAREKCRQVLGRPHLGARPQ